MAGQLLDIIRRLSSTNGRARTDLVLNERGEDADAILADCLLRRFVQLADHEGFVQLTPLGLRVMTRGSLAKPTRPCCAFVVAEDKSQISR